MLAAKLCAVAALGTCILSVVVLHMHATSAAPRVAAAEADARALQDSTCSSENVACRADPACVVCTDSFDGTSLDLPAETCDGYINYFTQVCTRSAATATTAMATGVGHSLCATRVCSLFLLQSVLGAAVRTHGLCDSIVDRKRTFLMRTNCRVTRHQTATLKWEVL